jgi:ABC-type Fe3+/spermidine/putrescine transport system ATPase subunit
VSAADRHLQLEAVTHRYGPVDVLHGVTLSVEQGQFVSLLGPSGCGKTTLLRIVAGFLRPTAGRVLLGGRDVSAVPPHRRPVNTVFQRPTLFPHLDVGENVAFGLRLERRTEDEIERRVREALALVQLPGYERRRSHELSGGQMQRVALARVLIKRPEVLLLDEPLSALDLAIRLEMEAELRRVHRETGATFVYVTHDQREAMALSDRIVVLNRGRIEQAGPPEEIYRTPASPFAARFVGNANVVPVDVVESANGRASVGIGPYRLLLACGGPAEPGPAWLVLRPETLRVDAPAGGDMLRGRVCDLAFRGAGYAYRVAVEGIAEPLNVEMAAAAGAAFPVGAEVGLSWDIQSGSLLTRNPAGTSG